MRFLFAEGFSKYLLLGFVKKTFCFFNFYEEIFFPVWVFQLWVKDLEIETGTELNKESL